MQETGIHPEWCSRSVASLCECTFSSHAIELLQGKWKMEILFAIRLQPIRLGQLMRLIPSASKKVIVASLRELELSQIIVRRDFSRKIRHVEYDFAEKIRSATISMLDHLAELGKLHLSHIAASRSNHAEGQAWSAGSSSDEFDHATSTSANRLLPEQADDSPAVHFIRDERHGSLLEETAVQQAL